MSAVTAALAPQLTEEQRDRQLALKIAAEFNRRAYGLPSGLPQLRWIGEQWAAGNPVTRADADRHFGVSK